MAKLLVQETTGVREFELVDNEVHIGRELDNTLRISDPSISRHHAVIRRTGTSYEVQDLQSSNGVLVNGTRVQTGPIQDGDRLTLGQIQITFVDPTPAAGASPLGTMRMDASEMAKLHATNTGMGFRTDPVPSIKASDTLPAGVPVPTLAPPPPVQPRPVAPAQPFEEVKGALFGMLPPVPDPAQPTGERGDFLTRLLAHLLDAVILSLPLIAIWVISAVLIAGLVRVMGPAVLAIGCVFSLLYFGLCIGYLVFIPWCWIKFGATPGKKIMKLRVVPEDDPTGRIDVGMAVLRMLGHFVNGMLASLPYLMILGSERKGLQDIFSKTIVIKVDR